MKTTAILVALGMSFLLGALVGTTTMRRMYESDATYQHQKDLFQETWDYGFAQGVEMAGIKCREEMIRQRYGR
jgi:hypothetical protein